MHGNSSRILKMPILYTLTILHPMCLQRNEHCPHYQIARLCSNEMGAIHLFTAFQRFSISEVSRSVSVSPIPFSAIFNAESINACFSACV